MKKNKIYKKIIAFAMIAVMGVSMAACGDKEDGQQTQTDAYVYVPEFIDLSQSGEDQDISDPQLMGDDLYYRTYYWNEETEESGYRFYRRNIQSGETTELPLRFEIEGVDNLWPGSLIFDEEGNMNLLVNAYNWSEDGTSQEAYWLFRFDSEGNELFRQDVTQALTPQGAESSYVQQSVIDKEGRLFASVSVSSGGMGGMDSSNAFIVVLDKEGNTLAQIDAGSDWINAIGMADDGTVLITRYNINGSGMECLEVDPVGKTLGDPHGGMPNTNGSGSLNSAPGGGLLVNDGSKLWKYDLNTDSAEEVLTWTDCDINGSYVRMIQALEDGRIAVYSENWSSGSKEMAYLTRTESSQVTQKQVITIATMWSSQDLQESVVTFNKTNDSYKVRIVTYYDDNTEWTENKYQDAITALNTSITSSNCPDIIDLSYGNVDSYVSKGLLVDLSSYLEKSSVKRDDFVESVLQAYTFGDTLVSIPTSFSINTIMGRVSQLGDRTSWTIRDIMDFAAQYPEAKLFNYSSKGLMLSTCLQYSSDAFIDYSTGKCSFDSQDFIDILEFCNTFDAEADWDSEGDSFPKQISDGRILLNNLNVSEMTEMQMYSLMFNEPVTFIGYPTVDGSSGNRISGSNCYAITTKSSNPDGAWAFIESLLQYEPQPEFGRMYQFPTRKDMLEENFAEAMKEEGEYDENGEPVLDENGEPIIWPKTTWGYDDWSAEIYAATPEQVQMVRDLIDSAVAGTNNDETILEIINEEAAAYFEGQKSAQEVADIIQSRVQTYVSENS